MADEAPDWARDEPAEPDWAKEPERGVMQRAGEAMGETAGAGLEAGKRLVVPPVSPRDYLGPSGMWRSFKETGAGILSPLTTTLGALTAGGESLAASGLGAAQRGLESGIAKGVGLVSPEAQARLESQIPTSEQAYETARPYAEAALSAIRAPSVPTVSAPLPPRPGPFGVTLTEGEATGALPAIKREQAALRAQAGQPAYGHAEAFRQQRAAQLEQAKSDLAAHFDRLGNQIIAQTPQEAGEMASTGLAGARNIAKAEVDRAYKQARGLPGEIHAGAFEGMPQHIKGDLSLLPEPVVVADRTTPAAAEMINYLDDKIGRLRIQNLADPFGPPSPERITGVSLNGIDQWRRNLAAIRRSAATPEDGRAARAVMDAFDQRIDRAVNSGLFTGDPDAVFAWNTARAAHADYRATFTKQGARDPVGSVVEKILGRGLQDPATPNDVMRFITGASGTTPNSLNVGVAKRIKSILGEGSPEWTGVKQGVFRKLVERPEDVKDFGHGVIANRLGEFINGKGKELAEQVYSPAELNVLRSYQQLMRKLEVPQAGANWSNNTPLLEGTKRIIKAIASGIGAGIGHFVHPGLGEWAGAGAGYAAGELGERMTQASALRRIARQMPLVAEQVAQWQRAVAKAHDVPLAGKAALALSSRRLAHSIHDMFQGTPTPAFEQNQQKPDWARFKGGRVTKSFRVKRA